ncbi:MULTISPECIES: sigma-70 family RNA polymerase sigma factor [Idiomarinaceae]|nr:MULTISPECIES: sigma-70 family RNA polymerase sigma factor [Idiomarinaceae]MRJ40690.1 sigma-70 family RNA polymerase sigma factor [Idiomarina sp. FeN1]NCU56494.1 sigma-70 family RNA polymerase sigma factor [Idiomarina sp. FenA--70]NCU58874.1 sigma-70 family RNA polymerase sigma factor [Idiomarina sp. FenBw--71]UUN14621.1 sigma-70 family RNA polymerase sigma factor [Idiomarina loihiensis]
MQIATEQITQRKTMPPAQPDNPEHAAELLAQIATEQSRAAFSELFKHFAPRLQAYATRQFGNEQTAMDLVQETMTNVWHKAHLFKPDRGSAATWIFTIARNIRFDFLRKNKYRQNDLSADDLWPVLAEQNESLDDDYALDDDLLMQQLAVYCEQLPPAQKTVIELIYIEGKSQQEVADALDIPLGTVKSRTRLALQKLKELIQHD